MTNDDLSFLNAHSDSNIEQEFPNVVLVLLLFRPLAPLLTAPTLQTTHKDHPQLLGKKQMLTLKLFKHVNVRIVV